jgi:UDPglucose 6-dehydrogenase
MLKTSVIFICVPTPTTEEGSQDTTAITINLDQLIDRYENLVVIKSTVLPGTTQSLQNWYPSLKLFHSPEFLTESTALEDFQNPDKVIVGYTDKTKEEAWRVVTYLPYKDPSRIRIVPSEVAETTKYMVNSYYALRVIFANQIYDLCEKLDIEYEKVRDCFELDKRVGPGHFEIFYKGKTTRGYSGKCLPKDTKALINLGRRVNSKLTLLEEADKINGELSKI